MDQIQIDPRALVEEETPNNSSRALLFILCAGLFLLFFVGCSTAAKTAQWEIITGPDHELNNVHRLAAKLPERLRRVAILPLSMEPGTSDLNKARESLEPILQSELDRLNVFEVIRITPEQMRQFSGRSEWSATDKLPQDFLSTLKNETGADGVMFCRLTRYHAYPPLAIGWSLKLVDATDAQIWWAADEMFDSADPRVVNSARRWQLDHQKFHKANPLLADSRTVLISPSRLGQYSAATLFATLPAR
jgi:hypothetical protein